MPDRYASIPSDTATAPAMVAVVPARPRKLSFKEQRELEGMEAAIQQAEAQVEVIEALFASPDFHRTHGSRTAELTTELEQARQRTATLYARWEELEAIRTAQAS